ncbi:lipase family protein [Brevibacillus choshinensis]|uniref:Lipase family protein n=1 Tax=Brevibacillus choshinensis TaxID=54911 RepID=A0ABX7FHS1_BRECH|nr:lipase family protein [Brevibacillus choshinensis]QRG65135.1 lipase family protein [Brevibacillus choshinensis]
MVHTINHNGFTSKEAILLAAMCYQTYPLFFEGELLLPKGFKLVYTIRAFADVENPTEHVYGFLAESKEQIVIAFRGYAAYPADLLAAYDILQVPYSFVSSGGKTSRGFTCLYRSTRNELIRKVSKLSANKHLFITGHNYGGALAVLAALDIAVNTKFHEPFVYTYGSPRIGDPEFSQRFNQVINNSMRIVNIHDPYPTFPDREYPPPFTEQGVFYQHVKTKVPISFQLNNTPRNDAIACYFKALSQLDPDFTHSLCTENPGFCPDTTFCVPFQGACR